MYFNFYNGSQISLQFFNTWYIDDQMAFMTVYFDLFEDFDVDSMSFNINDASSRLTVIKKTDEVLLETFCDTKAALSFYNSSTNKPVDWNSTAKYQEIDIKFNFRSTNCSIGLSSLMKVATYDVISPAVSYPWLLECGKQSNFIWPGHELHFACSNLLNEIAWDSLN